jgi:hypothetical protein
MPIESKTTLRISDIPGGTTEEQFKVFMSYLCAPTTNSKKHNIKAIFSGFKVRDTKNKSSPTSSTRGPTNGSLSALAQDQVYNPLTEAGASPEPRGHTITSQHGCPIGTISFSSVKSLQEALLRHEQAKRDVKYLWKEWHVSPCFQGATVLYEYGNMDDIKMEYDD